MITLNIGLLEKTGIYYRALKEVLTKKSSLPGLAYRTAYQLNGTLESLY
jgi:hypothetical protein